MDTWNPNQIVAVPIAAELYQALARRFPDRISTVIENVAWDFLERTVAEFTAAEKARGQGIFWKALFLPSGTELRVPHFGQYKYARLDGEALNYAGKVYPSISKLAKAMRGNTNVNAWKYVQIKRPTDADFVAALWLRRG